jgi:hypothetical protein
MNKNERWIGNRWQIDILYLSILNFVSIDYVYLLHTIVAGRKTWWNLPPL